MKYDPFTDRTVIATVKRFAKTSTISEIVEIVRQRDNVQLTEDAVKEIIARPSPW